MVKAWVRGTQSDKNFLFKNATNGDKFSWPQGAAEFFLRLKKKTNDYPPPHLKKIFPWDNKEISQTPKLNSAPPPTPEKTINVFIRALIQMSKIKN